jgi:peptide/nickel transport system substrate-binding protein
MPPRRRPGFAARDRFTTIPPDTDKTSPSTQGSAKRPPLGEEGETQVRRRFGAVLVGSLAVALAATGCQSNTGGGGGTGPQNQAGGSFIKVDDAKGPAPAIPNAAKGGTVTILGSTDFDDRDPQAQYRGDGILVYQQLIFRSLTGYYEEVAADGKITLKLMGDLATSTGEASADCKTWTYKLRDGIKFQDGATITSKDIAYGISRSFDGGLANGPQYIQKFLTNADYEKAYPGPFKNKDTIAPGIETPDDKTIIFKLSSAHCDFPMAAALTTTIPVPKAADTGPDTYANKMVASGPYQITSWTPGEKMVLDRNPAWDPATDPMRHNYPDKWVFDWTATDDVVATKRFETDGAADQAAIQWSQVPSEALPGIINNPAVKARAVEGDTVFNIYVNINTTRVTDVDVRRALNYAYNKDAHLKIIGGEYAGKPSTTITAPTVPGYEKYDAYPAPVTGDVEKAKALLQGKTVPPLRLCYRPGTPIREQVAAAMKQNLERAGFQIVPAPTDATTHNNLIGRKSYAANCDLMTYGWGQDYPSNSTVMGVLMKGGSEIKDEGNNNISYFDNAEVNKELDRLSSLPDVAEAAKGYMALDKKVMTDFAPLIPVYYDHSFSMRGSKLNGLYLSSTWGSPSLQNVWVTA